MMLQSKIIQCTINFMLFSKLWKSMWSFKYLRVAPNIIGLLCH